MPTPASAKPPWTDQPVSRRTGRTVAAFKQALIDNLYYTQGQSAYTASPTDLYTALAHTVRDYLVERWRQTVDAYFLARPKFVYYLSAEYLPGKQLMKNLFYTGTVELARQALAELGLKLEDLVEPEPEPGLGGGGLGRLAACILDSLATLDIPSVAYGIRYEYGIFMQSFEDGWQVESPDEWLGHGNPWEFPQPDDMVEVKLGGFTQSYTDAEGRYRVRWIPAQTVLGEPSHALIAGCGSNSINLLRLWRARGSHEFDFRLFDAGDYARAVEQKTLSESLSKVLYPNDNTPQGRELRLKQQYFFVACSLQNIAHRILKFNESWLAMPDKAVIQLNDTHPVVAIPELMRVMVDDHALPWEQAWDLASRTFAYTCHTLMPEAFEKWPVSLFGRLLPRHLEIVHEINRRFLDEVRRRFPGDEERVRRMSIIEETPQKQVRMAHLACVGCFSVNGVAELHSSLLAERTLRDFHDLWPEKFGNKTNGVSPRRFMHMANPRLDRLISGRIGAGWLTDLEQLRQLEPLAEVPEFRNAWREVKRQNKADLAAHIQQSLGLEVDPDSIFDVMVKRLHEYKRQLLKVLHIVTLYDRLKADPGARMQTRSFVFGAKAAPGYQTAKRIIKLIHSVAQVVNHDGDVGGRLRVAFLPNFNVTLGEKIYPAADISEQISLAGTEASGTGNMKFALNGAITVGTLDGANIEIRQRVGADNFFLFGLTTPQVAELKSRGYDPRQPCSDDVELRQALERIASGHFSGGDSRLFEPLLDSLLGEDPYLVLADYRAYLDAQARVERAYLDAEAWTRMSILNVARSGFFSSDRTVRQYCDEIWKVGPLKVAPPG
jgi:glycogen phosphorylase